MTRAFQRGRYLIIDRDGIIRYRDIHDITGKPENEILFAEIAKVCT
ncbi:MAG: hypothetical protein NTV89_18075 [Proteobacteria bacterium]|nr:hypothetical protein [Pseudomonadota bacterium]